jgi:hypothetical protein
MGEEKDDGVSLGVTNKPFFSKESLGGKKGRG